MHGKLTSFITFSLISLSLIGCNRKALQEIAQANNGGGGNNTNNTGNGTGNGNGTNTNNNNNANTGTQQNGIFSWNGQNINGGPDATSGVVTVYEPGANGTSVVVSSLVALSPQRCVAMGDGAVDGSPVPGTNPVLLGYQGRMQWAMRCFPQYATWFAIALNARMQNGNPLPLYPTFGFVSLDGVPSAVRTPINPSDSCTAGLPANMVLLAFCVPGCYSPDQEVYTAATDGAIRGLFDAKATTIETAAKANLANVVTLSPNASVEDPLLHSSKVDYFIKDSEGGKAQPYITFTLKSGKTLRVTPEHPMLDEQGDMMEAGTLAKGQKLFTVDGADEIVDILKQDLRMPAHNVAVQAMNMKQSLVVSQKGIVTGDHKYQSRLLQWMNRALFRRSIPGGAVGGP